MGMSLKNFAINGDEKKKFPAWGEIPLFSDCPGHSIITIIDTFAEFLV